MKAVGYLRSLRSRLAGCGSIVSPSIPTHQINFWVLSHPSGGGFCCPIRQEINHLVALQVHQDGPEVPPATESEIVYAKLRYLLDWHGGKRHDAADNGPPRGLDA